MIRPLRILSFMFGLSLILAGSSCRKPPLPDELKNRPLTETAVRAAADVAFESALGRAKGRFLTLFSTMSQDHARAWWEKIDYFVPEYEVVSVAPPRAVLHIRIVRTFGKEHAIASEAEAVWDMIQEEGHWKILRWTQRKLETPPDEGSEGTSPPSESAAGGGANGPSGRPDVERIDD